MRGFFFSGRSARIVYSLSADRKSHTCGGCGKGGWRRSPE